MVYAPYHSIVRLVVRAAFATIGSGNSQRLARQFRGDALFRFSGDHALGGELHGRDSIEAWFARLARLFPSVRITPLAIVVNGGPWATTVATRFAVRATLPDGSLYTNEGMQYLRLRWTAIVEDLLFEDTAALQAALETIAASGNAEALARPLGESAHARGPASTRP